MPTVVMIGDYADNAVTKIFSAISKKPTSDNYAITIKSGGTASDKVATIPDAVTGLTYNGKIQTGVPEGAGYVITDNTGKDAGDYAATAELIPGYVWDDGTDVDKTINWKIDKKNITVSTETVTKTYDTFPLTADGTITGIVSGETVMFEVTGTQTNAGYSTNTYTLEFNGTANTNNYKVIEDLGILTVMRANLTKPTKDLTVFIYNGEEQIYKPSGFILSKMNIVGEKRKNAGSQDVSVSIEDKVNYEWVDATQDDVIFTFTIASKSLPSPEIIKTVTYNGKKQTPILIIKDNTTDLVEGIDYSAVWNDNRFTNAGIYTVIVEGKDNYAGTSTTAYKISPKVLVIKAANTSATFPDMTTFTVTYHGFVNGETESDLGGIIGFDCGYDGTIYQQTFDIIPNGLISDNYDIFFVNGILTVEKGAIQVPNAVSGLIYNGQTLTGVLAGAGYTLTGDTAIVAGDYTANAKLASGYKWDDDSDTDKAIVWTIAKKNLIVTADDKIVTFPEAAPEFTATYSGFISGEGVDNLSGTIVFICAYDGLTHQEYFLITPDGLTSNNYNILFVSGKLMVTQKTIAVPIVTSLVYNGQIQTGVFPSVGYTLTDNKGKDAGDYIAIAKLIPGYTWSDGTDDKEISWAICKKNLNITANDTSVIFRETVPTYTFSCDGFIAGENTNNLTGTVAFSCAYDGSNYRASFTIVPSGFTSNNYEIVFINGILTVSHKTITVPTAVSLIYNGQIQTGIPFGEGYTLSGNTGKDVKEYVATASLEAGYKWSDGVADKTIVWTIGKKDLIIKAENQSVTFPKTVLEFTATYIGLANGETEKVLSGILEFKCAYDGKSYRRTFSITPVGYTSDNYTISFSNGTLTVNRAPVTVPEGIPNLVYNGQTQTGVLKETGYTVTGNTGKTVKDYSAVARLEEGYEWLDGTTNDRVIGWKISKKHLTVRADDKSMTFLGLVPEFTVTYSGFVNGETSMVLGGSLGFDCNYDGTYYRQTFDITPKGYISNNYAIDFLKGILTVGKVSVTVPDAVTGLIYSGKIQTGIFGGTGYTITGNTGVNAGNHHATASLEAGYTWPDGTADKTIVWTIGKKNLAVKAEDRDVIFLEMVTEFTVTYSGFVNGETSTVLGGVLGFDCDYDRTVYAPTFAIMPKGLTSGNYKIVFTGGTLTVGKASVTVPGAFTDLTYNGKTQIGVSEGIGYTLEGNTGKDAKDYTATASLRAGYEWSDGTVTHRAINWSISKKGLTVTADGKSIEFSDPIPGFTVTYDGFVNGETSTVLGGSLGFVCDYDRTVYAPTFAITPKGLTSDNYGIVFAEGILTVHKAAITAPDAVGKLVYNGKTQIGVLEGTGYTLEGNTGKGAGDYVAYAKLVAGYKWSDDSVADIAVGWSISKKELTVTADDKSQVYLESVPEFTVTYGEFAETEDRSVLGGVPRFSCAYDGTAYRPMFTISPSGHTSDNYEIIFVDGTLTVDKISVSVPGAVTDLIYNGKTQTGVFERTGYTLEGNTGTNAGSYSATAFPEAGYEWSDGTAADKTIGWKISKKNLTVTADDKSMTFLESVPEFTVTYDGFVNGESEAVLERFPGCDCAYDGKIYRETFVITPKGCLSDNYEMDFVNGILTVGKACATRPQAITGLIYNGTVQTGIPKGIGYRSVSNASAVNAGDYVATVSPEAGYLWSDETDSDIKIGWTIGRKDVTVTTSSASKTYDGEALVAGGSVEGLVEGDGVMFTVTGIQKNAGTSFNTYSLTPGGSAGTDNYNVTENLGTLTVNRARLEKPTAGKTFILYDGTEKTYCPSGFDGSTMEIEGNKGTRMGLYKDVIVFIKDMINYEWTDGKQLHIPFEFHIVLRTLPNAEAVTGVVYNGESQAPILTIRDDNAILTEGKDYKVVWNDTEFVNAGTYTADVTGIGKYSNFYTVKYVISKIRLDVPTADPNSFIYDGEEKIYNPVGFDGKTMDILGNRRANEGTQTVTVSIKDTVNYEWADGTQNDAEFTFTVGYKILPEPEVAFDVTYNGKPQMPAPMVADGFTVLNMGIDYVVVWNDAEFVNAGVYMAKITGIGEYSGTRTISYVIAKVKLDKPTEDTTVFVCDGTEKTYRPVGFDETIMGVEGNVRTDAGSQTVTVSILDEMNYEWADGTQENLTFRFVVGAPSNPPAAKESNGIYTAVAAAAAVMILIFCVRYFYGRP